MKRKAVFSLLGTILIFSLLAGFTTSTAQPASPDGPQSILANPSAHWVHGLDWPLGVELTMTIGDYSAKSTTVVAPWDPTTTDAYFDLTGQIDLVPGDIVIVTGDNVTKELTITNLTVTSLDVATNTLSGTASPGVSVSASADAPGDERSAIAGEDGKWIMAPVPGGFVLGKGVSGCAVEIDSDGDQTRMDWSVPNPRFDVRANVDEVGAYEWTVGETLTLTIGDHKFSEIVHPADCSSEESYTSFNLAGIYDIQPGDLVSLTNGTITKTTIVTGLETIEIDVDQDTVKGKATAGSKVDLWACVSNGCFNRHVTADSDGNWLADFAHSGAETDEQDIVDLLPGTWADSRQVDEDSDSTMYGRVAPNPRFEVLAYADQVEAYEWTMGETLTLTIGDQEFSETVHPAGWNPKESYASFNLAGIYDIQPGDLFSLTNGTITKTTIVTGLEITEIDVDQDTVKGKAAAGSKVDLGVSVPTGWFNRHVTADDKGNWLADFAHSGPVCDERNIVDLLPGTGVNSWQADEDGDTTCYGTNVPNPNVRMTLGNNQQYVEALEWQLGEKVTLSIFSDAKKTKILFGPATKTVEIADWDPNMTYVDFTIGGFQVVPGMLLVLTNGVIIKEHVVLPITVTEGSSETDYFAGTTTSNSRLQICGWPDLGCREAISDSTGYWRVDYAKYGIDIKPGSGVNAEQYDEEGDSTIFSYILPNPRFDVRVNADMVEVYEWKKGETVTLQVGGHELQTTLGVAPWDPGLPYAVFELSGIHDIQPGDLVILTNDVITKTTIVTDIEITGCDVAMDTVSGRAEGGTLVIWACESTNCITRHVNLDDEGNWLVDFAHPGLEADEQNTFDIVSDNWIDLLQWDDDGDSTIYGITIPNLNNFLPLILNLK